MYHNIKTLYEWVSKRYPALVLKFNNLEDYCNKDSQLSYGYNSLHWAINSLRDHLNQENIEDLFFSLLCESIYLGESFLYENILASRSLKKSTILLEQATELVVESFTIGRWKVSVNMTPYNHTSLIFKKYRPDVIISSNKNYHSASIIGRKDSLVLHSIGWAKLGQLLKQHNPGWKISHNSFKIGGPKSPEEKTGHDTESLLRHVSNFLSDG